MVEQHHTDEIHQHAQALEREYRHTQDAFTPGHTGRVVLAESTAFLAGQTVAGTFWNIPVMWQILLDLPS